MEVRSARFNRAGGIDCEINHPDFGWIPFTASADDIEEHGRSIYSQLMSSGKVQPYNEEEDVLIGQEEE